MTDRNCIVAVGLLTQSDIDRLGGSFNRMFPVGDASDFQELLDAIDRADAARRNLPGHGFDHLKMPKT